MSNNRLIEQNIRALYGLKFMQLFLLVMPIIVPFFVAHGMTNREVFLLQSIYSIVMALMEVPSGYIGDALGRRRSIIVGSWLALAGYAIYAVGMGFSHFLAAAIVLGTGASFVSGSDSAILFDSLKLAKRTEEYTKYEGRLYAISNFAEATAALIGGLLVVYSLRFPFYGQLLVAGGMIFFAYRIAELPMSEEEKQQQKSGGKGLLEALRFCLIEQPALRWATLLSASVGSATLLMAWTAQPYFMEVEVNLAYFGALWMILNASVGLASWFAYKVKDRQTMLQLIFMVMLLVFGGGYIFAGISASYWGIIGIWLLYLGRGIGTPVLKDLMNIITPSEIRATVLSVRSLLIRLTFATIATLMGYLGEYYSISTALILIGCLYIGVVSMIVWALKREGVLG